MILVMAESKSKFALKFYLKSACNIVLKKFQLWNGFFGYTQAKECQQKIFVMSEFQSLNDVRVWKWCQSLKKIGKSTKCQINWQTQNGN